MCSVHRGQQPPDWPRCSFAPNTLFVEQPEQCFQVCEKAQRCCSRLFLPSPLPPTPPSLTQPNSSPCPPWGRHPYRDRAQVPPHRPIRSSRPCPSPTTRCKYLFMGFLGWVCASKERGAQVYEPWCLEPGLAFSRRSINVCRTDTGSQLENQALVCQGPRDRGAHVRRSASAELNSRAGVERPRVTSR